MLEFNRNNEKTVTVDANALQQAVLPDLNKNSVFCLTWLSGASSGESVWLRNGEKHIIGRQDSCSIVVNENSVSRVHAFLLPTPNQAITLIDNASANGTYINGKRLTPHIGHLLTVGDRIRFGNDLLFRLDYTDELDVKLKNILYQAAVSDPLTSIYNRRYFMEVFEREYDLAIRGTSKYALIVFDVDHFKKVNDHLGHAAGDKVLTAISSVIQLTLRKSDVFARIGGEEFAILLRNLDLKQATILAERIRKIVADTKVLFDDNKIGVTVSLGLVSSCKEGMSSPDAVLRVADLLLYKAKDGGRNCLVSCA